MSDESLRLAPIISVGVVGHRPAQLLSAESKIEQTISGLLSTMEAAAQDVTSARADVYSSAPARLMIWNSLAEGTDRIVARLAGARECIRVAVLPLPRQDYIGDFSDERSRSEFHAAIETSHHTLELAGSAAVRPECYERAARIVIDNSDLIIAVWDGEWARGPGGTGESVDAAVRAGKPVVIINPARPDELSVAWRGWDPYVHRDAALSTMPRRDGLAAAELMVSRLLTPLSGRPGSHLTGFLKEENRRRWRRKEYSAFLNTMLPGKIQARHAMAHGPASTSARQDATADRWFQSATESANYYGGQHSSQIVTKFAVVAVLSLIFGLVGLLYEPLKSAMIGLQVAASAAVFFDGYQSRRKQWRRRWIEYRLLAERVRTLKFLRLVAAPLPELGWFGAQGSRSVWFEWLVHRIALSCEPLTQRFDDPDISEIRNRLLAEIDLQLGYHAHNRLRFEVLERRLSRIRSASLIATILLGVVILVLPAVGLKLPPKVMLLAGAIITLLPSLTAAVEGIRVQADFARIAERGRATRSELIGLRAEIRNNTPTFDRLRGWAGYAAATMAADVAQWRMTIESKDRARKR